LALPLGVAAVVASFLIYSSLRWLLGAGVGIQNKVLPEASNSAQLVVLQYTLWAVLLACVLEVTFRIAKKRKLEKAGFNKSRGSQ
jgi:hypothetical protein